MFENTEETDIAKRRKFRNKSNAPKQDLYDKDESKIVDDNFGATTGGANARAASSVAQTVSSGGSTADIATAGLMASGNPYAMGAGLGLSVLSAGQKRREQEENTKALAKQDRIQRQQRALENLTSVSQGLRRL